ncbi:hypothetical protein [Rhodococcus sp. G-MC3]|uniref:hypothetical protein n=1 Tax=Rhodococcus sp. G-MC3 TaxID=3046209 RepID=UPI0024BBAF09|nr:hypothetical protein [Rhodococcus sp. G-MC3]
MSFSSTGASVRLLLFGSLIVTAAALSGCTSGTDKGAQPTSLESSTAGRPPPTSVSATSVAASTIPPSPASTSPVPPLEPTIASTVYVSTPVPEVPVAPRAPLVPYVPAPSLCTECETVTQPSEPVMQPPNPVDSRGLPLGTTCGAVSCTSPGGIIFVNPDAVPNLDGQGLDLCEHTYCPPPGFQIIPNPLPSTGSSGG